MVWAIGAIAAGAALWTLIAIRPPLDDIDAASRAQLEEALREAERAEPVP